MARTFYGLLNREGEEVIEFYLHRDDAELDLAGILGDVPGWAGRFEIVIVDFSGVEPVVRPELRWPRR